MNQLSPEFIARSKAVFVQQPLRTLADAKRLVEADRELAVTQRRDLISALTRISELFQTPLEKVPASRPQLRALFASRSAAQLNLSEKTLANIRSLIVQVLDRYAGPVQRLTKRFSITDGWRVLLDQIELPHQRQGLYRLATYCSVMGTLPEQVTSDTLVGLRAALEAEEVVKNPKVVIKNTISCWNRSARGVPAWPNQRLAVPTTREAIALPLSAFPVAFQQDLAAWRKRMTEPDPLDEEAPARALRPATIEYRMFQFRQFASALVQSGHMQPEEIVSLRVLFEPAAFKAALRVIHARVGRTQNLRNLARAMRLIAKHYCGADDETLITMENLCRRLDPGNRRQMAARNRTRLAQFDDPRNVSRLLRFPEEEARRAERHSNPMRAAKGMERAVAVALLIYCGLRIGSLRTLKLSDFTWTSTGLCSLVVPEERTKSGRVLEYELNMETAALLRRHIAQYRQRMPGSDGTHLFAGPDGKPRSTTALSDGIGRALRRHAGLEMNPHLFRHAIAKIAVEADPGAYLAVSRVLGHTTINTTMGYYLGTETKAAGRHVDRLLTEAKAQMFKGKR